MSIIPKLIDKCHEIPIRIPKGFILKQIIIELRRVKKIMERNTVG